MVRAQDITSRNLVESWRLANAELIYASTGDLGKPKKSMLSRILGMLWP
jgi:flagellar basal body L-ring protein FlgH